MLKVKGHESRLCDSHRIFSIEKRSYLKGEVIDQTCLRVLEGQITLREEGEKVTFDAAVAFEILYPVLKQYSVLKVTTQRRATEL